MAGSFGLTILGLVLLFVGGEGLVRSAATLARMWGISPLVVGLTVVSIGTSAPELAVSVVGVLHDQPDIVVGNVVGSNIFNVLFVLGLCGAIAPLPVARRLVAFDLSTVLLISLGFYVMASDGALTRSEGFLLLAGAVVYTLHQLARARGDKRAAATEGGATPAAPRGNWVLQVLLLAASIGVLVLGSNVLVHGATTIARALGVSELIVGLTIVALGTSLPETTTTIVAALRGERDIAVGNAIGSNIYNLTLIVGTSAGIAPNGIAAAPEALAFDIPVMVAVTALCVPVLFTGWRLARSEGWLFLILYALYVGFLILDAQRHDLMPAYRRFIEWGVFPLAGAGLLVSLWRSFQKREWRRT
jgi:cation:H+ antiporter